MNPFSLLEKYYGPGTQALRIVTEHSRLVAAKAVLIAEALPASLEIDLKFVEEAALLHDIGVCRTNSPGIGCHGKEPYIRHGIIGREILESEGFPRHALVCERHIGVGLTAEDILQQQLPLPLRNMSPRSREERVICFADLFYSKKAREETQEKSVDQVRRNLEQFGSHKVLIFDEWCREFKLF